ncbi:IS110 family transposase [Pedobacter xixiisoli]|uniref:Transposase n=1 Tax=Pedobacter xixiisoli TaxID=1476464 RepID=A0A286A6X6_9SPHI|nr:IS110 family transposase [Pedobacter xixiisoli]SOD17639.1 Transposase [Pedobacter xixiisoli]
MLKIKNWRFDHFFGVDVSKNDLDITMMFRRTTLAHYKIGNNTYEIQNFIKAAKQEHGVSIRSSVFGMEQTGIYCNHLLAVLEKIKANVIVQNALHIKNSLGTIRGKNDKLDSQRIARYLLKSRDELLLRQVKRPIILELTRLTALRERLISVQTSLRTPLGEETSFIQKTASDVNKKLCEGTLSSLANDIIGIEDYIRKLWKSDERLNRLMAIITSLKGVGDVTALKIILTTNEFLDINDHKKFACYCGVAPFEYKSGTSVRLRTRVSKHSNRQMKSLMHTCAVSAKRFDPELASYFHRRTVVDGKPKMSVINAIRFKMLARIFTCVREDRLFQVDYKPDKVENTPD